MTSEEAKRKKAAEYNAKYYVANKEKIYAQKKEYRARPEVKAKMAEAEKKLGRKAYYVANKEKILAQKEEYRARPEVKARMAEYHARPEVKAQKAEYNARPEAKAKGVEYRVANKEKIAMQVAKYRARPEVKARIAEYRARPKARAWMAEYQTWYREQLAESYLKTLNQNAKEELDLLMRATSVIYKRVLKGAMNVEQAHQTLERLGSPARIPTPENSAPRRAQPKPDGTRRTR